jgi:hypothetical protein
MPTLNGQGVQSGPMVVHIDHEPWRPGWVRLHTHTDAGAGRKRPHDYHALVRLSDLMQAVAKLMASKR